MLESQPMPKDPLISIYMPTKNRVSILKRAVNSVLDQTYTNWELIVIDDASTDGTAEYLSKLTKENTKIQYYSNKVSYGACVARNKAISMSNGSLITGLDDDDEFLNNRLELLLSNYSDEYSFVSTGWTLKPYGINAIKDWLRQRIICKSGLISSEDLLSLNHIGNQVLVKKERLVALGGFDEKLEAWQDYDMWLRLVMSYGSAYRSSVSTQYINDDQSIVRITHSPKRVLGIKRFLSKHSSSMTTAQINRMNRIIDNA